MEESRAQWRNSGDNMNKHARKSFHKLLAQGKTGVVNFGTYKCSNKFQSTRPRGARLNAQASVSDGRVSIHAPVGGATTTVPTCLNGKANVSIHAPAGGATGQMPDKKTCENCGMQTKEWCIPLKVCDKWTRNPRLWLAILPEEPGVYFYSKNLKKGWSVGEIMLNEHGDMVWVVNNRKVKFNGQWQGPIKPEGE